MSSNGNALIMKMGLDLNDLQRDFKAAEKLAVRAANDMQSATNHAQKGGGGGHGGGGSMARPLGDTLDALTGERGWVMKMTMLQHSLPIAAAAALAIGVVKAKEAFDELVKSSEHAHEVLSKPMGTVLGQGGQAVSAHVEELRKAQDDLHEKTGVMATIGSMMHQGIAKAGNGLSRMIGNQGGFDDSNAVVKSHQQQEELEKQRFEYAVKYKEITGQQIEERREAAAIGGKDLELTIARQRMEKDIADIQANAPTETKSTMIAERQAAFDLEKEEIDRKHEAQQRELDLQRAILDAKMTGRDVAIEEAKARVKKAEEDLANAKPADKRAAQIQVDSANLALTLAKQQTAEHRAQLAIAESIANFRGPEEEKQFRRLLDERDALEEQLKLLGEQDDKRNDIQAKIDENIAAERAWNREQDARSHQMADTLIDAIVGTGQEQQASGLAMKLANAVQYQSKIANNPEVSDKEKADAAAKVNQLQNQQEELARSRAKAVRDAQSEVDVLSEQLAKHAEVASFLQQQHEYEEKIAEARYNGNTALEQQLRMQQQLSAQLQLQHLQSQVGDTHKATLGELASHAMNESGRRAREAQRLEKRYNDARMRGHGEEPYWLGIKKKADGLRQSIAPLKDSEKKGGIEEQQLEVLKKIEAKVNTVQ